MKAYYWISNILVYLITLLLVYLFVSQDSDSLFEFNFYALFLPLIFSYVQRNVIRTVLEEKESKMLESLKMMGMRDTSYLLSFFVSEGMDSGIFALIISIMIYYYDIVPDAFNLIMVYFAMILFALSTTAYSLLASTYFNSATLALVVSFFAFYLPSLFQYVTADAVPFWRYTWLLWAPNTFMGLMSHYIKMKPTIPFVQVKTSYLWMFMLLDLCLYTYLYIYFEATMPSEYGVKLEFFQDCFKEEGRKLKMRDEYSIQTKKLTKIYNNRTIALNEVSMNIPKEGVFCLLGHNGAGKTSFINILTGLTEQTSGLAYINGYSTKSDMASIRLNTGVCQQFDILYDELSVSDHMYIAYFMKGISSGDRFDYIENLKIFNLDEHLYKKASELSGGMKRMLSLCMSLAGNPQLLFMDEPTSSMDAEVRSRVRKIIKKYSKTKTVVLTTQHMDEAEELADKVALMSKGRLHTLGTVDTIRNTFGVGYNITLINSYINMNDNNKIEIILNKHIKGWLKNEMDSRKEISKYVLPFDQVNNYSNLFKELSDLEINFGLEKSSLEEAFINFMYKEIEDDSDDWEEMDYNNKNENFNVELIPESFMVIRETSYIKQFFAILRKRILMTWREWKNIFMIVLPMLIISLSLLFLTGIFTGPQDNEQMSEQEKEMYTAIIQGFAFPLISAAFVNMAYSFGAGLFIYNIVRDRVDKCRYLQNIFGMSPIIYWLGNLFSDMLFFTIPVSVLFLYYYNLDIDIINQYFNFLVVLTLSFGFELISLSYLLNYFYSNSLTAYKSFGWIVFLLMYVGCMFLQGLISAAIRENRQGFLYTIYPYFQRFMMISPCMAYYTSITTMGYIYILDNLYMIQEDQRDRIKDSLAIESIFIDDVYISIYLILIFATVYMIAVIMIDYSKLYMFKMPDYTEDNVRKNQKNLPIDSNVDAYYSEREHDRDNFIKTCELTKTYQSNLLEIDGENYTALYNNNITISKGEIFGLLGPNGAGKSTFFNIATLHEQRSSGDIQILGQSIESSNITDKFMQMGVCPQQNIIYDTMSVYEHLWYYAMIKGLNVSEISTQANYLIERMDLEEYRHINASDLSGGNKRKLLCAISLISCPLVVFLDEPTTGVDPVARMKLRNTIKMFSRQKQSTYMYTTHWMSEAEQLCDRVCILINGRVIVVGSIEELRQKYGDGYSVALQVKNDKQTKDVIRARMHEVSEHLVYTKKYSKSKSEMIFKIPTKELKFHETFDQLLKLQHEGLIKDFSINQANLEQVFLYFARYQEVNQSD